MVDLLTFDTEVRRSIVQEITAEDTTHAPSGDAVHDALSEKVDKETGKGLFSGSYNDLTDKPTIPDVSGKLNIAQTSHKGKNVVVDGTSGNISFEDKYSHPSTKQCNYAYTHPSTKQCNASIPADISDLTDNTGIIPEDVSDLTDTQNTPFTPKSHSHTVSDLPTANSITDGDTTHIATVDVIHDYIDEIIGDADDWLTS